MFPKLVEIVDAPTDNPIELARIAGCDVRHFFRGASFWGVDVRGLDLRSMDLTGADFSGIIGDEFTRADDEFINEIQFHSLATLIESIEANLSDDTYMDHYDILISIRELSQLSRIGVSGKFERYFQDGTPEFSGFGYSLGNGQDPKLQILRRRMARTRHRFKEDLSDLEVSHILFEVSAPGNYAPCDQCRVTGVSVSAKEKVFVHFENLEVFVVHEKKRNKDISLEVEFQSLAIPSAKIDFGLVIEKGGEIIIPSGM